MSTNIWELIEGNDSRLLTTVRTVALSHYPFQGYRWHKGAFQYAKPTQTFGLSGRIRTDVNH